MKKLFYLLSVSVCLMILTDNVNSQGSEMYKISRMSFNSSVYSEISPVIVSDGILFCSDRRFSGIFDRTAYNGSRLYNFYSSIREDSSKFGRPEILKSSRSYLFNNGPFCLAPDGRTIYFTSEIETGFQTNNRNFRNHSGIFFANYSVKGIGNIKPFKYNNPAYNMGQPSISSDGRYLFFASDMPGGEGGSDIYYCELVNGDWSTPKNLGPVVNSAKRENYPYIHSSGKLYFASDRPGGIGKLDIYYTSLVSGEWQSPTIVPEPVNSPSDDFAFVAEDDMGRGFFASNRGSSDDIYQFTSSIVRMDQCDSIQENSYCYSFFEKNAVKSDSIPFRYTWIFEDGSTEDGATVEHCFAGPGKYIIRLDAVNLVTNEILHDQKIDTLTVRDIEQPYISSADTVIAGQALQFDASHTYLPDWNIGTYYWNFGDETVAVGEKVNKVFIKTGVYGIQLIVSDNPEAGKPVRKRCVLKNILVISKP